jgi:hypothetical protein
MESDTLEIELYPEKLGKIKIKCNIDNDDKMILQVSADKLTTLGLLQQNVIELQDIIGLDGNETYLGYGGNGEGGGMNVEMWIDKGDEFFINETEESNIAFDEEILLTGEQIGK